MKFCVGLFILIAATVAQAEPICDVRVGESIGMKVMEFASGHIIHSKMSINETTASALHEEMISLQEMGICAEEIVSKKCILRIEKKPKINNLTLYRGEDKWGSWTMTAKKQAEDFVKSLKRVGFCS